MKSSQLAKSILHPITAFGIFAQCEQMVMGITSGVSVPLPLNKNDEEIVVDVVVNRCKEVYWPGDVPKGFDRALKHRAAGLFKQWLIQKGRIK